MSAAHAAQLNRSGSPVMMSAKKLTTEMPWINRWNSLNRHTNGPWPRAALSIGWRSTGSSSRPSSRRRWRSRQRISSNRASQSTVWIPNTANTENSSTFISSQAPNTAGLSRKSVGWTCARYETKLGRAALPWHCAQVTTSRAGEVGERGSLEGKIWCEPWQSVHRAAR